MELRNRVRYRLSASAVFSWEGAQRKRLVGEGVTRDVSVDGAFIFTRSCPPIGALLDLQIALSPSYHTGATSVQIRTMATVIRVEHAPNCEGFAAASQDFTLLFDSDLSDSSDDSNSDEGTLQ
jgi:hypothetical protein